VHLGVKCTLSTAQSAQGEKGNGNGPAASVFTKAPTNLTMLAKKTTMKSIQPNMFIRF
jgi:hypothetical protein